MAGLMRRVFFALLLLAAPAAAARDGVYVWRMQRGESGERALGDLAAGAADAAKAATAPARGQPRRAAHRHNRMAAQTSRPERKASRNRSRTDRRGHSKTSGHRSKANLSARQTHPDRRDRGRTSRRDATARIARGQSRRRRISRSNGWYRSHRDSAGDDFIPFVLTFSDAVL